MKKYLPIALAIGLLSFGIAQAATTVPWQRTGTSIAPLYIGDNVGVGTTTPNAPLTVYNASTTSPYLMVTGTQPLLQIGSTSPTYGYLANDRINTIDSRNDYSAVNVYNHSSGNCATADLTAANDLDSSAVNFIDIGHTSSGFTGVGCVNNPFTGFGSNAGYIIDPNDDIIMATQLGNLRFFTGGYATTNERLRITPAGLVGIGTTSPTSKLEVQSSSANAFAVGQNGAQNPAFQVDTSAASSANGLLLSSKATGSNVQLQVVGSGTNEGLTILNKGNATMSFQTNASAKLALGASSNVHTNIQHSFASNASTGAATIRFSYQDATDTALTASTEAPSVYFNLGNAIRTHANGAIALQRDFRISGTTHRFTSSNATSIITQLAALSIDFGDTNNFGTTTNNSAIYIPPTALVGTTTNAFGLQVFAPTGATNNWAASTTGRWNMNGLTTSAALQTGIMCLNATGEVINESVACVASAARYKTNVASTTFSLEGLMKLTPVSFDWKKSYLGGNKDANLTGTQYSLIADDVQKVFPQLVAVTSATTTFEGKTYAPGSVQGLEDTNHWLSAIVSWLQQIIHRQDDQQKQIDELKAEIEVLKANHK